MKRSVISNSLRGTFFFLFFVLCSIAYAGTDYYCDFSVNGIYYLYVSGTTDEVAVSYNNYETGKYGGNYTNYSGYVSVPATVTYNGKTYKVTAVSDHAFQECSVTTVNLPNTIKSIGYAAFLDCYQLTSVNLPSSITTIGDNAFNGCTVLGNVILPTALKSIGGSAFQNCKAFTSIVIPDGVTTIGASAFSNCSNLASISIPSSVVSVGSSAFSGTAWYTNLPDGMVYFGSTAYNYKGTMPENTTIEIKEGTTNIAGGAFTNCVNLVSVSIPSSVTSIGNNAFYYCSGLKEVVIPGGVKSIKNYTFYKCSALTSVKISDGVTSIGDYAFFSCFSLNSLNIPNSVTTIGNYAFDGCSGLTSVTIGSGVAQFGDYAFAYCTNLASLEIKDGVTSIGNYAFQSCNSLSNINLPNSLISIGIKAFNGCAWIENMPDGVVYAGKVAYSYKGTMSDYTNITLKEGTLGIAASAFSSYSLLSAVTLPCSLKNIGPSAFYDCSNLTSVIALMEAPVSIDSYIFNYRTFATLYVPNGCKAAYEAADYWKDFKEIVESSPQTQDRFDVTDENGVKMTYQIVSESDKTCEVLDADHNAEKIVIPLEANGYKVVGIADGAFYREVETSYWEYSSNPSPYFDSSYYPIKRVTCLSTTPIRVGENAFMAKYYFVQSYVTGQDEYGNDLYFEGQVSVDQQSTIATLVVPNGCYDAYDDADLSRYFETILEMALPSPPIAFADANVKALCVANWDTDGDGELSEAEAAAVKKLGEVFKDNKSITSFNELKYFTAITELEYYAFHDCENLKSIVIPENVKVLGYAAFAGCHTLETANIPNRVTVIEGSLFRYCEKLGSINIPDGVTKIGLFAFDGCNSLTSIVLPSSLETIEAMAFYCSNLTSVTVGMSTPIALTDGNDFGNHQNATLYVPYGCKAAYEAADYWKDFKEIVEIQPEQTDKETLSVGDIKARSGSTVEMAISLTNESEDLTAYQFDLILTDGISLGVNDKGKYVVSKTSRYEDDSQTLNVSKLEGSENTYRFVCFSLSNEVITGTSGAILNAALTVGESVNEDSYEATITNIVVTKTDGTQLKLNNAKFNIVVNNVIPGDANGDGEVNVTDIVEIVNYIMEKPSDKFVVAAADLNGDGEINVTDIVRVVNIIMSAGTNARKRVSAIEMVENDQLTLAVNDGIYSLGLCNEAQYVASQFEIRLADGQTLEGVRLNGKRSDGHLMSYTQTGNNVYKVLVFSTENRPFSGNSGELLSFKVSGNGSVEVSNILFVTSGEAERMFPPLYTGTTGIDVVKTSDAMDVYSIDGRMVRRQVTNTNGLEKGVYIINGKKTIVK